MAQAAKTQKTVASRASAPRAGLRAGLPLAATVINAAGVVDIDLMTQSFNMTKVQLAQTIGLAAATLQKADRRDSPKTQARVTEVLEVLSRVEAWAGGRPQAMAWYRAQPIAALGGRTAEALVKSGQAAIVRDYLDHIAVGGFA